MQSFSKHTFTTVTTIGNLLQSKLVKSSLSVEISKSSNCPDSPTIKSILGTLEDDKATKAQIEHASRGSPSKQNICKGSGIRNTVQLRA